MINYRRTVHLILQFYGRKLHIECYGICVIRVVVDHRNLLENRLYCQLSCHLWCPIQEVIRHDSGLDNLEIDIYAFVEPRNHKEVVKQVVVTIRIVLFSGDDALIWLIFYEKKEPSVVTELESGVTVQAIRLIVAIRRLGPYVSVLIS